MAEANIAVAEDQFSCSICLDLLKDPVTIPCGHSYCMSCITNCWNQDDLRRVYSCPQCRQTFTPRPALNKNVVFAEMVEKLRNTKLQTAQPDLSYTGAGDVECDVCVGRKSKAVKSCLVCRESYCQTHFERHEEFHSRRHKVTDATRRLKQMICSKHDKQLEIFCRTDQSCICYLCTMDEHRNHDTVAAVVERAEKQKSLEERQGTFLQSIQEKEKKIQELKEAVKSHKISAQTAVEDTERMFTELISSIERSRSEVIQMIRDQERTEVNRAEGLLEKLKKEIEDLSRRHTKLTQLSNTEDHTQFLQGFQFLSSPPKSTDVPIINAYSHLLFDNVGKSVSELKENLESSCKMEVKKISGIVTESKGILQPPSPPDDLTCPPIPFASVSNNVTAHPSQPNWAYYPPTVPPAPPSLPPALPSLPPALPSLPPAPYSFLTNPQARGYARRPARGNLGPYRSPFTQYVTRQPF